MPSLRCPICAKTVEYHQLDEVPYRPFCSQRCKMIDLGRWLNEEYRISEELPEPGSPEDERQREAELEE